MSTPFAVLVQHGPGRSLETVVAFGPLEEDEADLVVKLLRRDFGMQALVVKLQPATSERFGRIT